MRLYFGAPRQPIETKVGLPTVDRHGREVSYRTTRRIVWLCGVSWRAARGFVFFGFQRHENQGCE